MPLLPVECAHLCFTHIQGSVSGRFSMGNQICSPSDMSQTASSHANLAKIPTHCLRPLKQESNHERGRIDHVHETFRIIETLMFLKAYWKPSIIAFVKCFPLLFQLSC